MASQFGSGNKNPPWARQATDFMAANAVGGMAGTSLPQVTSGLLQQPGLATNPAVYSLNQATAMQQQQYAQSQMASVLQNQTGLQAGAGVGLAQPGMALPTTLGGGTTQVQTVSYPTARSAQSSNNAAAAAANQKQRVFTGTVTKLHDNFGFIDEDVFFQTNCVKGMIPKVGDRVLVEASYNPAMPFKWNATRVQVLSNAQPTGLANQAAVNQQQLSAMQQAVKTMGLGAMGAAPGGVNAGGMLGGVNPLQLAGAMAAMSNAGALMGSLAGQRQALNQANRGRGLMRGGSGVNRPSYESSRFSEDRDRERDRGRDRDRREKRESRRRSRSSSPASRTRSPKRKVSRPPPRYVVQAPRWTLNQREANVILLKSKYANMYIPSDFFHSSFPWVDNLPLQRPFALGQSCKFHVMHKEVGPLTPETAVLEPPDADHKYSAKVMLLTCPSLEELYSKSCALAQDPPDMQESFQHPTRLVQFLVGTRGKNEPMAIGGPWSPSLDGADPEENPQVLIKTAIRTTKALTGIDLSKCTQWYRFAEIRYLRAESRDKPVRVETVVLFLPDVWRCSPSRLEWTNLQKAYTQKLHKKLNPEAAEPEDAQAEENAEAKREPTHFSQLDPKTMKLQELREELDSRTLSSKGLKSQLIARLTKALLLEEEQESVAEAEKVQKEKEEAEKKAKEEEEEKEKKDKEKKDDEEQKRKEKKERQQLERRYAIPENPAIIVHPSLTAKSGKFDCSAMTLSLLLDYRPEDNKEHSFEVSLFAELFNEMLMRDFGFAIYKALVAAPPKQEEEKKKKDKEKDKEKDKDKDKDKDSKDKDKDKKSDGKSEEPPAKKKKVETDDDGDKDAEMEEEDDNSKDDVESSKDGGEGDDDDDDRKDKDKKDSKRDKKKFVTVDPGLLLACVYYDQNHCSYLQDRDVEEIVQSLGLDLSRAQVRKLVQKVLSRECFYYRKMCDVPQAKEGEPAATVPTVPYDLEVVARGNADFLIDVRAALRPEKRSSPSGKAGKSGSGKEVEFVMYRGSVIDLDSLMQKLEGSDKSRILLENKLADITTQLDKVKSSLIKEETTVKSVKHDLVTTQAQLQAAIAQRINTDAQHVQLEAARVEARNLLQNALALLSTAGPHGAEKEEENRVKEAAKTEVKKEEEANSKHKDNCSDRRKEEDVSLKKEK